LTAEMLIYGTVVVGIIVMIIASVIGFVKKQF